MMMPMLDDNIISDEYVVVDTETTGLDPNTCEIVEVAAIKFNKFGEIIDTFQRFCRPTSGVIPIEASSIHGITMDKVANEKPYMEVRADLATFIGKRTLIGHNLKAFDIGFLKLQPVAMEDTLEMCRKMWPGRNNLANACKRVGIKFDPSKAHGALYDVEKTVELYLTLINMNKGQQMTTDDKQVLATQVYSFSRINLFLTCPFKWKQAYLLRNKEPDQPYFVIGRTVHKIAQLSALWSYMKTFANKFEPYAKSINWNPPKELLKLIEADVEKKGLYLPESMDKLTTNHIGMFLYRNSGYIQTFFGTTIIELITAINEKVPEGEYEIVSMPDMETYSRIINTSIALEKCLDADAIKDVTWLSDFFYKQRDFSLSKGEVALVEKQFVFDKEWQPLKNWNDERAYMRGALDVIEYNGDNHVTIIDYKTSRKMLTEEQLKNDLQLKIYVLFVHKYLPDVTSITVKHHYIRFGKIVTALIENVPAAAEEAATWIRTSINEIEREMLKPEAEAFQPCRNEFCGNCYLMERNQCPLFSVKNINDIKDPENFAIKTVDDFRQAWKKVEVNKAEIKNLTAKCKAFLKNCQGRISIDQNATVDFWAKEDLEYDALKSAKLLLEKKVDLSVILQHCSMSKTEIAKLLKRSKVGLSQEEVESISVKKIKMEFDAFTSKEIEDAGFLNR
jgi:DNA polymerase III subunit epsilon